MEKRQEAGDLSRLLPDDALADVLRRAAPRDLAVSRCVCRAWRALVDGRRLLRPDLLPRSLAGLFIEYTWLPFPKFFARPSIDMADYHLPRRKVWDHCNGLLLYYDGVLNPATGRWTPFPDGAPPPPRMAGMKRLPQYMYLAFDPTLSSHYQVFAIPSFPLFDRRGINRIFIPRITRDEYPGSSEWPPSPYNLNIFSSRTGRWEERLFVRENEAAGTAAEIWEDNRSSMAPRKAVCWRGALYVHCQMGFIMRISLSDDKYRVIKPPRDLNMSEYANLHIGKSEKGVYSALLQYYSALLEDPDIRLRVWILDESGGQTNWILKHDSGRGLAIQSQNLNRQAYGHWILESDECNSKEAQEIEWNSDDDDENVPHTEDGNGKYESVHLRFLEFHPYREIVFLLKYRGRGLAYHLNSSKVEDLGNVAAKLDEDDYNRVCYIIHAFPYTPCLIGEFSEKLELSTG